jgi:hypothetical protein
VQADRSRRRVALYALSVYALRLRLQEGLEAPPKNLDVIADYTKGAVGTGDLIDFSSALTVRGSSAAASSTQASINPSTGEASFATGSDTTLADALSDIAARFTAATDTAGEFALFRVNQTGNFYVFISDGANGVTANDVVIQLTGITSVAAIDLTGGNLTLTALAPEHFGCVRA